MFGEYGYKTLVRSVLNYGRKTMNRTGVETRSLFAKQLGYSIRNNRLAITTVKHTSLRNVMCELLFFLRGDTNQQILARDGVNIWKANSSREFLDSRNLQHYREHESLGPIYGFQWRHFNAEYIDCHADYIGRGVDQLEYCVDLIKNDPNSRRILMTAWNPSALDAMVLPPCHILIQFEVNVERKELSAHVYQRSADLMLGVPYNLCSYSALLCIMARRCNLKPADLVFSYGNVHIYKTHFDNARVLLTRPHYKQPILEIANDCSDLANLKVDDFTLKNYRCNGKLKFEMTI
jgi:thymidylate synthase